MVDDEHEIGSYLVTALGRRGHQVDTALDGKEACDLIDQKQYDLILTDLKMPGMTGFKLYNFIKEKHPDLLNNLLVMTGDTINKDAQLFLKRQMFLTLRNLLHSINWNVLSPLLCPLPRNNILIRHCRYTINHIFKFQFLVDTRVV